MTRVFASDELEDAGFLRRMTVRLHLLRCRHCREYVEQLRAIGSAVKRFFLDDEEEPHDVHRLEDEILGHVPGSEADSRAPDRRGQ